MGVREGLKSLTKMKQSVDWTEGRGREGGGEGEGRRRGRGREGGGGGGGRERGLKGDAL